MRPHTPYQPPEDGLPPQEVRIISLKAEPWPENGRRVRIHLDVTPFLERPDMEVSITNADGEEVSSIHIIESIEARMTFTMHIKSKEVNGTYTLTASLQYEEAGIVDTQSVTFEIREESEI